MPTQTITNPAGNAISPIQGIISALWPSFLTAAVATVVFFALFDPRELAALLGLPELSRLAGYSGGFFGFWLLTSSSSTLTGYFLRPCDQAQSHRESYR